MCGIVGFVGKDQKKIQQLSDLIRHRGPDDGGVFVDENISLGHRRLSIIDLSFGGHQPMFYLRGHGAFSDKYRVRGLNDNNLGIVYNGEFYNYQTIKEELQSKEYNFTTSCDTEVILASYLEWGEDCVKHFNGMWAFCIYDKVKGTLFLSVDRMGQKPIYYSHIDGKFVFGSELKCIMGYGIPKKINQGAFNQFILFGYPAASSSMLEGVNLMPPGHSLVYDIKNSKIQSLSPHWKIPFEKIDIDEKGATETLKPLIENAVKMRMLADVPVGAFLSGGVDSSVIVYNMRKYVNDLKTFSIKFDYEDFNESKWAKIIAEKFGTDHYEIAFTANDVKTLIDDLAFYFDEPFGDSSMIPTYLVSKVARQHVTVCLSGTGADELFAGYPRYNEYFLLQKLIRLPSLIKEILITGNWLASKDKDRANKLRQLLYVQNDKELYLKLFSQLFRNKKEPQASTESFESLGQYLSGYNKLDNLLNFDLNIYLPKDLLVKEDRATMANSLEGRIPFMDYRLVKFANSLPQQLKLKGKIGKYILKKTYEGIIPNEILYRRKQGFGVPLKHYFRNELKSYVYDLLFNFKSFEYYNKGNLKELWLLHQSGKSDYSAMFWKLCMFNKWYERWMK